jgi:hypothetical protein
VISLLVPLRLDGKRDVRAKAWDWVRRRWAAVLPEAELVMGTDDGGEPFSKTVAVNDAYRKSSGNMLVIADADSWVERDQLGQAIEMAWRRERLVVPWMKAYRFPKESSDQVMAADPAGPLPVTAEHRRLGKDDAPSPASAAMVLCIQRRAFERVGGMDPRFRGWGSEDVSFGLSCWTMLGRNAYILGEAYALYHPRPLNDGRMRVWRNDPGSLNFELWHRYQRAQGRPELMTALCREHSLGFDVVPSPELTPDDIMFLPDDDNFEPDMTQAPVARERQGGGLREGERI